MRHTVEELVRRLTVMRDKAVILSNLRNEFIYSDKEYDKVACENILADIQTMALMIANDKENGMPSEADPE